MNGNTWTANGRIQQKDSVAAIGGGLSTAVAPTPKVEQKVSLSQTVRAIERQSDRNPPEDSWKCKKHLLISIFFDGTGNNLDADLSTMEHSNVARMYRAHMPDDTLNGISRIYVPGIGTLFPAIRDDGCVETLGVDTHGGMGAIGQARLDFAFEKMQKFITTSEPLCKEITMISLSVFGFSRGATLARAFMRDLLNPALGFSEIQGTQLHWKRGKHPLEVRFVGLWDTVAAVGVAMSGNNVKDYRSPLRWRGNAPRLLASLPGLATGGRLPTSARFLDAATLAFGTPGADPAPGPADGHAAWADGLAIPGQWITGQCVHMIAAHEQRNSFPLDSVLRGSEAPPKTMEIAYPGMHSDVGGGYRPGEGGRGRAARAGVDNLSQAALKPSQISLRTMYDEALAAGVPLRHMGNPVEWQTLNRDDFQVDPGLIPLFNHYMAKANTANAPLGDAMLAHMRLYFAWRFQHIKRRGRVKEDQTIEDNKKVFDADAQALKAQKNALAARRTQLLGERKNAGVGKAPVARESMHHVHPDTLLPISDEVWQTLQSIDEQIIQTDKKTKEVQARIDTLPSHGTLAHNLDVFDDELLYDVRSIADVIARDPGKRALLRPHYRNLLETYEAEFIHDKGLRDEKIIAFFDNHIHDSLADFNKDWTLPSDPRVIYTGGDSKLRYASLEDSPETPRNLASIGNADQQTA